MCAAPGGPVAMGFVGCLSDFGGIWLFTADSPLKRDGLLKLVTLLCRCAGHGAWQAVGPVSHCQVPLKCHVTSDTSGVYCSQSCRRIMSLQAQGGGPMHRPRCAPSAFQGSVSSLQRSGMMAPGWGWFELSVFASRRGVLTMTLVIPNVIFALKHSLGQVLAPCRWRLANTEDTSIYSS